ncbi:magnesium-translocating P-type ATPase [Sphingobium algorifonticola]|uniref:Magnesium-transporting ATPase, P-type 1 n=1 Tax=Sphingobium algorifonticola TaxID=2008318 RepID=A0A437J4F6_9SPHN|nr:magnesium-translocating P-type ATPase [Sphingobium algorifonticola]RVT39553.1 magnesium-translocating P-type ATPase [Sphingobium algorifonticola]
MSETRFWTSSAQAAIQAVGGSPAGLSAQIAAQRLAQDGPNSLGSAQHRRLLFDLARRLANPLVLILLAASAVAGLTGDLVSFTIIAAVILLSTLLDMIQEHRAQNAADALRQSIALRTQVLRDGAFVEQPVQDLVAGDVVALSAGDLVPADGIILSANAAQANEALLTGEPYPVEKKPQPFDAGPGDDDTSGVVFRGTSLVAGSLQMLVVATGKRTRLGAIADALHETPAPTAFEHGIHRLGMLIVRLTIFLVLFVLLAHLALGRPPLQSFLFAMALAVGLTPELLPMIMTVALSRGAQRMAASRVVVKRLSSIHDLGQMDILCTDKTGTLTEAHITLVGHPGLDGRDCERVIELAAVNARFESGLKSPLDEALLEHMADKALSGWTKIDERPFDFERRRVSVLAEHGADRVEIVKGAPETVLALCDRAQTADGRTMLLDEALRREIIDLHDARAAEGLRLLGVAWKAAPGRTRIEQDDDGGLIFCGYCVFVDPPKPSATSAVARLEAAGIGIKVISGDAAPVVRHLVGTLSLPVNGMMTGSEIAALSDQALAARVEAVDIFARVTPDQKTRIVRALRARGHTVGFIGDGINDAPAIRAADVGLSVDGATDVARDAADMILLAPDLGVLADGVLEGRRTYANIMKYLRMGTSSNFGNMLTMAVASLWLPFLPLTPVQVLLNNLLYDLSQIGIPLDGADREDLAKPHAWDMAAIMRFTAIMGPLSSLFDIATFALLIGVAHAGIGEFRGAWFIESMASQILVGFVIRTSLPFWRSRPHRALVASAVLGMAGALALPFGPWAGVLGFTSPSASLIAGIAALILVYLATAEWLKGYALRASPARSHNMLTAANLA